MSDTHIVTQHFDDPIGSVMEIDGKCYVKVSDKTDVIDKYIYDGGIKTYYQSHKDFIDGKNATMLCQPKYGTDLYSFGHIAGDVILSTGLISTLPTDIAYDSGAYSMSYFFARNIVFDEDRYVLPTDPVWDDNNIIDISRITALIIAATNSFPS